MLAETEGPGWNLLAALFGALIGGSFTVLATLLTLRHERKNTLLALAKERENARLIEIDRIRWTKRWDVMAEMHRRLSDAYWGFRGLVRSGDSDIERAFENAKHEQQEFDDCYRRNALFLPPEIARQIKQVADEFITIVSDERTLVADLKAVHSQKAEHLRHARQRCRNHENSLIGGKLEEAIQELENDMRRYLDEPERQ